MHEHKERFHIFEIIICQHNHHYNSFNKCRLKSVLTMLLEALDEHMIFSHLGSDQSLLVRRFDNKV